MHCEKTCTNRRRAATWDESIGDEPEDHSSKRQCICYNNLDCSDFNAIEAGIWNGAALIVLTCRAVELLDCNVDWNINILPDRFALCRLFSSLTDSAFAVDCHSAASDVGSRHERKTSSAERECVLVGVVFSCT